MNENNFRVDPVTIKSKDIIEPLIEEANTKLSILKRIGEMKESDEMTWEEEKWLGRYTGVYCSVRNIITPPDARCQELLDILYKSVGSVMCNSWVLIITENGNRFKKCSINYNCPPNCRCGMNTETN